MWISRGDADAVRLPWWSAILAAGLGGWLLDLASPGTNLIFLFLPAVVLVTASVWQQRFGVGLLAGLVFGGAFWLPHIHWLTLYLGPIPWLALCGAMILWTTLFGGAAALLTRGLTRRIEIAARVRAFPRSTRLMLQVVGFAGLWTLKEQVQVSWPYGGFAWGRIGSPLSGTPYADLVSWTGFAGLSALVAVTGALIVGALWPDTVDLTDRSPIPGLPMYRLVPAAAAVLLIVAGAVIPRASLPETGSLTVGAIQGNSKSAIFDDRESGAVFEDHRLATETLLTELERSGETLDVIVWPENSAEFGLPMNAERSAEVAELSERAGAPIVVGTILKETTTEFPDGRYTNSVLVWDADGATGARYDKRFPVPFAEYMPDREFYGAIVPDLVGLVQLEYAFGDRPSVIDLTTPGGMLAAGIAICFDIVVDDQAATMVQEGAEIIFAPTNNADFGRTDQSAQQLEIARLRAVETGRSLVNISTVGTSALVLPTGESVSTLTPFTRDALVADLPLVEGVTPGIQWGAVVAGGWMFIGGALLLTAMGCSFASYWLPRRLRSS